MVPVDLAAEVSVLGRDPLTVHEFDAERSPSGAPRMGLGATFLLPGSQTVARPFVELRIAGWHANYDTALDYDATVLDLGGDLGFRITPFAPAEKAGAWAPRPFLDFTLGLRLWPLLHPWWEDELLLGSGAGIALGITLGDSHRNIVIRARYEAVVGPAVSGVVDSAKSDLVWTFDPTGGRLGVAVGFGWR